jgi:nucleoside-diphosphate-sugar epimerase
MTKPVIGITGATGFIGSSLSKFLIRNNYQVIQFVRTEPLENNTDSIRKYELRESPSEVLFKNIDILIHCAFIRAENDKQAGKWNYTGTKCLIESCKKQGVKKIVFFSSVSAHEKATSAYGINKLAVHELLDLQADVILQCSLVVGNGGLFHTLLKHASSKKYIPLIGSGRQIMQVIAIDDVLALILQIVKENKHGKFVVANHEQLTYRQVFELIANIYRTKIHFVPLPVWILKSLVSLGNLLRLHLPVSRENILGLQSMKYQQPFSGLDAPIQPLLDLKEKLKQMKNDEIDDLF